MLSVFLLTTCMNNEPDETKMIKNKAGKSFAGSSTCINCHKTTSENHVHTAHYLTSQPAAEKYIKGSFEKGRNSFAFNRSVVVAMEKRDSSFYQVEYFGTEEKKARHMDIVVGSGTMGQSFLNWQQDKLFQLPITFFSAANTWSNSPGFPDKVVFNRVITSRCLECHSTFLNITSEAGKEPETFDKAQIIYGVDCERCHGPAAEHVQFQTANPTDTTGKHIINPARLSRQQNLDLCALCHGGRLQKTQPSFTFSVGDKLSDYFNVDTSAPAPEKIDVHGNQYGLLRASKCFKMSATLTCGSCHNTHKNEKGNTVLFSQRCMTCHNSEDQIFCKLKQPKDILASNCIDCHMPLKPSRAIAVFLPGATIPTAALIRSHFIDIYPEETKRILDF